MNSKRDFQRMLTGQSLFNYLLIVVTYVLFLRVAVGCGEITGHTVATTTVWPTATVYRWQPTVEGDWQLPSSWVPTRTKPAISDVLVFDVGGTTSVANVPTQVIGQLIVSENTTVDLQSGEAIVLTITGGDGDDLKVASGSALNFNGVNAITASLATGTTARIHGFVAFSSPSATTHRLVAVDSGAVTFDTGSVFTAGSGFAGNPFGTTNLNSVIFDSGSSYICTAGGDPFGAAQPDSVVVFKTGSMFSLRGNVMPSFSGRSYANFEVNFPGGVFPAFASSALVMDDLTLIAGRLSLNLTGNPGHSIKGNITTSSGTILIFGSGTIHLNGSNTQTISGFGGQGADGASTIAIDNPKGVLLDRPFSTWNLELINGVVTTGPSSYIGAAGAVTRTNGYVNGYLERIFFAPGSFVFDVGTENGYSAVIANVTAVSSVTRFTVRTVSSAQASVLDPSKALTRHWELYEQGEVTADLTFHYLDPTDIPATANEANFAIQRFNNNVFSQPVGTIDTGANTFRINGVTDFARDWTLAEPGALVEPRPALFDYDADGRTDFSVFRPTEGAWYLHRSTAGFFGMLFGFSDDKIVPADYDGDGKTDIAIFRPSDLRWYIANSSDGTYRTEVFGLASDLPAPADYDGDGKADLCVFRPSDGTWYIRYSSNGTFFARQFGANGDKPTVGDFDGDGKADLAVFRTSNGEWYQVWSSDGSIHGEQFGFTTDRLAYADYDGDGKTDLAIFRPSERVFYIKNSGNSTYSAFVFGLSDDIPTPGDYDGDGRADLSVFRPSDGNWYRQNSSNGSFNAFNFGLAGDKPTPTAFH